MSTTDTDRWGSPLPLTPDAWEARARELVPEQAYDYYAGGAGDEVTLAANRAAWGDVFLRRACSWMWRRWTHP